MTDLLIGIDAGTSVIKAIAFDFDGRQIAAHAIPNRYETIDGAAAVQDMARTWTDTAATLKGLGDKVPRLAERTAAIAVTGQGDGTWLLDRKGRPVGPAWLWLDARAAGIVEDMRAAPADRKRYELTGTGLAACQQGSQLAWMTRHDPDAIEAAATAMHCKDWLYFNLTGDLATDPSEGLFTFGDFRTRTYSDEVIAGLGLTDHRSLLPVMVEGTRESARLTDAASAATGLLAGTPVVLGYVDVICTALGGGLYETDSAPGVTIVGSTGMHIRLARSRDDVRLNDQRTGYTMPMPIPGVYAQMQSNMASTLNIDWMLGMAAGVLKTHGVERSPSDLVALLDEWIGAASPASMIYQPYISEAGERGPFVDGNARAGFVGLSTRHGFQDMVRAVCEGIAFAARDCYGAMGPTPSEVRLTGGAARSKSLRRLLGSVIGTGVRTSAREEAGAAGAAMMAAVCIGQFDGMDDCAAQWVRPLLGDVEPPDDTLSDIYARTYPAYAAAHAALRPVWKMMAAGQGRGAG